jgi:nitroreductase/NAD-dependent dihydropyrimidine dehydrogenase PreA subunit
MSDPAIVDREKCSGCGRCVEECPASLFTLEEGRACVSGDGCLACGHCEAVCPREAVVVPALDEAALDDVALQAPEDWVPYGGCDASALVSLMRSRRSCRCFLETPVDAAVLKELARIGASAPSGTNCRAWTFTILSGRTAVLELLEEVLRFFKLLNKLAGIPAARWLSRIGRGELDDYHRRYFDSVERAVTEWEETGKDSLFFGAPAVMLVGSKPGASTPAEDALLATQNILLAAHAMGLGTCLIGFAAAALKRDRNMRRRTGLPGAERVHAVIAMGYTDRTFHRITRRRSPVIRVVGEV